MRKIKIAIVIYLFIVGMAFLFISCNKGTDLIPEVIEIEEKVLQTDRVEDYNGIYYGDQSVEGTPYRINLTNTYYFDSNFEHNYLLLINPNTTEADTLYVKIKELPRGLYKLDVDKELDGVDSGSGFIMPLSKGITQIQLNPIYPRQIIWEFNKQD